MQVSGNILQSYTEMYDSSAVEWRTISAKYKAKNIVELSTCIEFTNVLEVGCGEGSILYWLSKWGFSADLNGIDISKSGVELLKSKNIEHVKDILLYDGYSIPYADNHFDLLICSHVMEHVEYERTLLKEIKRVSKYQIFEVPIDFSFYVDRKIKHFLSYGHINIYTPPLFRFLLQSESFEVMSDKSYLYDTEILKHLYANNSVGYYKQKTKNLVLKMFPYLLGIKPNSYAVLTRKTDKGISIM